VPTKCSDVSRHLPPPDICSSEITLADVCRLIIVRVGVRVRVSLLRSELVSGLRSAFRVSVTVRVRVWGYVRFLVRYGWTEVPESDFRGGSDARDWGQMPYICFRRRRCDKTWEIRSSRAKNTNQRLPADKGDAAQYFTGGRPTPTGNSPLVFSLCSLLYGHCKQDQTAPHSTGA